MNSTKSTFTEKLFPALKWGLILLAIFSVLGGFFVSYISDEGFTFIGFLSGILSSAWGLVRLFLVLSGIYLLVYFPPIWLLRRWWSRYRARHTFKNDQTEKSLAKLAGSTTSMFGIVTIFYAIMLAFFGYLIAPDNSPLADNQVGELARKKPGFEMGLFQYRMNREEPRQNFFSRLWNGTESAYNSIPVTGYEIANDSIYLYNYRGETIPPDTIVYHVVDAARARSFESPLVTRSGDTYSWTGFDGAAKTASVAEIEKEIASQLKQRTFHMGTDDLGRDYLSRVIIGVKVSISVGLIAVFVALLIGVPMGAVAGYFRGWVDDVIMWVINVFWSIPTLLVVFPIAFAAASWPILKSNPTLGVFIAVGLTMWVDIARIVRGQVLSVRELEYVEAAKSFGFSNRRTIFKHILPNISGPVIVVTAANFAYAILIEAGLSFLGIGVNPPKPSWGQMLSKHKDYIVGSDIHLPLIPGFAIVLLVLSFFLIGNGLRDALDAKTKIDH